MLVEQQSAAAGASLENFNTRRRAALEIHDRGQAVAQPQADHDGGRAGDPPAYEPRPAQLNLIEQRFVASYRLPRLLGW